MSNIPVKKSIYNIENEYLLLMQEIEWAEGDLSPELEERLVINREDLEKKAVSYGYYIKSLNDEISPIKAEIERLEKLQKRKEKYAEGLKNRISEAMLKHGITDIKLNNLSLSFRKSKELVITDENSIPKLYKSIEKVIKIDKASIKKAIVAGGVVKGAEVKEKDNLQIK